MHLACASGTHQRDEPTRRRSPDDRVVDHDDALSLEHLAHRVVLDLYLGLAPRLRRLDEGWPDVVDANERELVRNTALLSEAERRRVGGIGYAEHELLARGG